MTDSTDRKMGASTDTVQTAEEDCEPVAAVGTYESGDVVVFYDTENPLAWAQSRETVRLDEMA